MRLKSRLIVLLFLCPLALSPGQSSVDSTLNRLLVQLRQVQKNKTVETLVRLDSALKAFVHTIHTAFPHQEHAQFWNDRYSQLGLHIGHYSGQFGYSERFLAEAHALNPNSPLRAYTLYSTILGIQTSHGLGEMPGLDSAFQYTREFPTGPYVKEVYLIIANFYKDLFMVLRDGKQGDDDYKYGCFESYIDQSPIGQQRDRTQRLAIEFYEKVLRLDPTNAYASNILSEVREGTVSSWSYCAD